MFLLNEIVPDFYFHCFCYSADLLEQIKALVHRHPDKLTVRFSFYGNKKFVFFFVFF
jgi:hypothetical protein